MYKLFGFSGDNFGETNIHVQKLFVIGFFCDTLPDTYL